LRRLPGSRRGLRGDLLQLRNKNLRWQIGVITLEFQSDRVPSRLLVSFPILSCLRRPAMKFSPASCSLAIVVICSATSALAQNQASLQARIAARQELELAKIDLQNYWQIEYPRQRRELNLAIELTKAEIDGNQEQQEALRPFTRFSLGEPFPLTIANLRICRKSAELRLNNLQAERNSLIRFHSDDFRILEMRVQAARQRVADLEANDEVTVAPPSPQR
jgi:hypothetical protein